MVLGYLKDRKGAILLLLACHGLTAFLFWLEHLPFRAVGYGFLLCVVLCLAAAVPDFLRYGKRRKALVRLTGRPLAEPSILPEAGTGMEGLWRQLVLQEMEAGRALGQEKEQERKELLDYYTMWVHQIKTPIAALRLLLDGDPSRDRESKEELFRIEQYVGMVLSYLRLSGDSTDFVIRRYPLEPVVRRSVRKFAPVFIRKRLSVRVEIGELSVLTDEKWLSFVLEQLLSNALKYTEQGGIKIYAEEPARLVIEDTGIGIGPEDLPRIWERGFTGCNGRSERNATGLGLYLCREILEKLGHGFSITSEPGRGTKVCLALAEKRIEVE